MSIILNFFGVEPVYACELVSLVPGRELKESYLQSIITAIYDPLPKKNGIPEPKIRIVQRGLASSMKNIYPSTNEIDLESQRKNALCDAILAETFREGGIPYSIEESNVSKRRLLTRRTDATVSKTDLAIGNIRKIDSSIPISITIPKQFWPFSFIEAYLEHPKDRSVIRIMYDVDLFNYRRRGCGTNSPELPLFAIPYTLFSPERIHHELIQREIRTAMAEYFSTSNLGPNQLENLIDLLRVEIDGAFEKRIPKQDLVLYVDTDIAVYYPCECDGVKVLSVSMSKPYSNIQVYRVAEEGKPSKPGYSFHVNAHLSNRKTCEILGGVVSGAMKESIPTLTEGVVNGLKPSFQELGNIFKQESRLTRDLLQKQK